MSAFDYWFEYIKRNGFYNIKRNTWDLRIDGYEYNAYYSKWRIGLKRTLHIEYFIRFPIRTFHLNINSEEIFSPKHPDFRWVEALVSQRAIILKEGNKTSSNNISA